MDFRSFLAIGKFAPCSAAAISRCCAFDLAGTLHRVQRISGSLHGGRIGVEAGLIDQRLLRFQRGDFSRDFRDSGSEIVDRGFECGGISHENLQKFAE